MNHFTEALEWNDRRKQRRQNVVCFEKAAFRVKAARTHAEIRAALKDADDALREWRRQK